MSHDMEHPICLVSLGQPAQQCPLPASCNNYPYPSLTQDIIHSLFYTIYIMPRSPIFQLITTTFPVFNIAHKYHSFTLRIISLKCLLSSFNQ